MTPERDIFRSLFDECQKNQIHVLYLHFVITSFLFNICDVLRQILHIKRRRKVRNRRVWLLCSKAVTSRVLHLCINLVGPKKVQLRKFLASVNINVWQLTYTNLWTYTVECAATLHFDTDRKQLKDETERIQRLYQVKRSVVMNCRAVSRRVSVDRQSSGRKRLTKI